jgi:hypothetical protein
MKSAVAGDEGEDSRWATIETLNIIALAEFTLPEDDGI